MIKLRSDHRHYMFQTISMRNSNVQEFLLKRTIKIARSNQNNCWCLQTETFPQRWFRARMHHIKSFHLSPFIKETSPPSTITKRKQFTGFEEHLCTVFLHTCIESSQRPFNYFRYGKWTLHAYFLNDKIHRKQCTLKRVKLKMDYNMA